MYPYTRLQQCQQKKGQQLSKSKVTKGRENILSLTQKASCNEQDKGLFHTFVFFYSGIHFNICQRVESLTFT